MKELLQEWAELEPERCKIYPGELGGAEYCVKVDYPGESRWHCLIDADRLSDSVFISARQAIEARDWRWSLPNSEVFFKYSSSVCAGDPLDGDSWSKGASDESPAHALLSAYLQAIRAKAAV